MLAGVMKFVMTVEEMTRQIPIPGWFLHFVGGAEILGAIGLVLPGILRIRTGLTPLAAAALVVIMVGATAVNLKTGQSAAALITVVVGLLLVFPWHITVGGWRRTPNCLKARRSSLPIKVRLRNRLGHRKAPTLETHERRAPDNSNSKPGPPVHHLKDLTPHVYNLTGERTEVILERGRETTAMELEDTPPARSYFYFQKMSGVGLGGAFA